jgi:hypothetical protein
MRAFTLGLSQLLDIRDRVARSMKEVIHAGRFSKRYESPVGGLDQVSLLCERET